jgi:hypothetical protein
VRRAATDPLLGSGRVAEPLHADPAGECPAPYPETRVVGHRDDQDIPIGVRQRVHAFHRRDHIDIAGTDIDPPDRQRQAADQPSDSGP